MHIELITPDKIMFTGTVKQVQIPGSQGEFGILPGHSPFISSLRPGIITIEAEGYATQKIGVLGGIAEILPERCTLLVENAQDVTSLTVAAAQTQLENAKLALDDARTPTERNIALAKITLAETLLLAF